MPGINQLPAGSEFAAAFSLIWAFSSWICSSLLLWLAWSHHEGWSYLALLAVSAIISNTCSIIQQGHVITSYVDVVTEQYERKQRLPGSDPELAIAGGSYGLDLVLYYIQYYNYNVQAMLVMFWAAELCQLTYQVGETRKIRRIFRKVHVSGKFVAWLLPLFTILCLRIPSLREQFVAFILIADLPLMLSLAIGSGLMIAVTIRYVQSRQKFTQWSPPKFNSTTTSEGGTMNSGTHTSTTPTSSQKTRNGLYDRWLMVRFTIAFILLAVFEVTNTLFQVTALNNNIHDARAPAPDLSAGRAIETMFLFMPGTTPGIFLYIVFGTTAASRQKFKELLVPKRWRGSSPSSGGCCFGRSKPRKTEAYGDVNNHYYNNDGDEGGIHVERSLTITRASRTRPPPLEAYDDEEFSEPSDISMSDLPKRPDSIRSVSNSYNKPLPLAPQAAPSSKFTTRTVCSGGRPLAASSSSSNNYKSSNRYKNNSSSSSRVSSYAQQPQMSTTGTATTTTSHPAFGGLGLSAIEEKSSVGDAKSNTTGTSSDGFGLMTRTNTGDSQLRVPEDDYCWLGPEHSDDSGPILPIQRPEVRFAEHVDDPGAREKKDWVARNFARPRR